MRRRITAILMALAMIFGMTVTVSAVPATTETETLTGSGTWTVPAGVTEITVIVVGGGGGTTGPGNEKGCGGGGGGGYSTATIPVIPNQTFAYTVGAGGSNNNDNSGNGGESSFGTIVAGGGLRGIVTKGGDGGSGNIPGGNGANANNAAYSGGNGGNAGPISELIGTGGAGGVGITGALGENGSGYGGGAGGSYQYRSSGNNGQTGAPGTIIITYILPANDVTPPSSPVITLYPDDEWTNADEVSVAITPGEDEEGGSGVAETTYTTQFGSDPASSEITYTAPFDITAEGITEISAKTYDVAGNYSDATATVKIDRTKPTIFIGDDEYEDGAEIYLGYIATGFEKSVNYIKKDDASGFALDGCLLVNCSESIPTDVPGLDLEHALTVTDRAGNSATITFKYKVISLDDLMALLAPVQDSKTYKINSNIPVKLQITEDGVPVQMSADNLMFALKLYDPNGNEITPTRTNKVDLGNSLFTLSADGLTYQYNLNTKGLKPGVNTLEIYIADKVEPEGLVGTIALNLKK